MEGSRLRPALVSFALTAWLALGGCGGPVDLCDEGSSERAPSLIVIVADTLRADYLGRHGPEARVSPTLDALAAESVVFTSAYAQAPWTKPSVASLLTGLHPQRHGVMDHEGWFSRPGDEGAPDPVGALPAEIETLAETLAEAGYRSAGFVANEWLAPGYGYEQGFDHYELVPRERLGAVFARAARWLAEGDASQPFFLYLHGMEVHGPYEAPAPFVDAARDAVGTGEPEPLGEETFAGIPTYLRASDWAQQPGARDLREWRTRYGAGVVAFDAALAVFLERVREAGWLDESVVVVTSDHGEELYDHGSWDHGATFFEEILHVPLIVRLPGGREGGRRIDAIASLVDVRPTLLELAGLGAEEATAGRSLAPALCGAPSSGEPGRTIASAAKHDPALYALRTRSHKLILDTRSGAAALFDLREDPAERRDVAALQRDTAETLARELWQHVSELGEVPRPTATAPVDPAMRARLEALGYVDPGAGH